jgi:hypothetical protein
MKYKLLLFCLCLVGVGYSQRTDYFLLIQDTSIYQTTVGVELGRLNLQLDNNTRNTPVFKRLFQIDSLYIDDADLNIFYQLVPQGKDFYWDLEVALIPEATDTIFPPINLIEGDYKNVNEQRQGPRQIKWLDLVENHLEYQQNYQLLINAELYGTPNCAEAEPAFFRTSRQWPYLLGFTLGVASISTGVAIYQSAEKDYDQYLEKWKEGALEDSATSLFVDANNNKKTGRGFVIGGLALLGAEAVLLGVRFFNTQKNKRYYRKYCTQLNAGDDLSLEVDVTSILMNPNLTLPAIKLTYTFK